TFLWIISYRDFNLNIGNVGADEAFLHPSSKEIKVIDGLNLSHIGHYGQFILHIFQ
ncbi:unnamed protein product, partial [Rotaria magnacalcarata]